MYRSRSSSGFTLIELLLVLAISTVVLASVLVAGYTVVSRSHQAVASAQSTPPSAVDNFRPPSSSPASTPSLGPDNGGTMPNYRAKVPTLAPLTATAIASAPIAEPSAFTAPCVGDRAVGAPFACATPQAKMPAPPLVTSVVGGGSPPAVALPPPPTSNPPTSPPPPPSPPPPAVPTGFKITYSMWGAYTTIQTASDATYYQAYLTCPASSSFLGTYKGGTSPTTTMEASAFKSTPTPPVLPPWSYPYMPAVPSPAQCGMMPTTIYMRACNASGCGDWDHMLQFCSFSRC